MVIPFRAGPVLGRVLPVELAVARQVAEENEAAVDAQDYEPQQPRPPLAAVAAPAHRQRRRRTLGVLVLHGLEAAEQRGVELRRLAEEAGEGLADAVQVLASLESLGPLQRRRQVRVLAEAFAEVLCGGGGGVVCSAVRLRPRKEPLLLL